MTSRIYFPLLALALVACTRRPLSLPGDVSTALPGDSSTADMTARDRSGEARSADAARDLAVTDGKGTFTITMTLCEDVSWGCHGGVCQSTLFNVDAALSAIDNNEVELQGHADDPDGLCDIIYVDVVAAQAATTQSLSITLRSLYGNEYSFTVALDKNGNGTTGCEGETIYSSKSELSFTKTTIKTPLAGQITTAGTYRFFLWPGQAGSAFFLDRVAVE